MLADTPLPRGFGAALASVDTFFPRAPEQFVTSPLCLVGYVRWDARSDRVPPLQTIIFSSFPGRTPECRPLAKKSSFGCRIAHCTEQGFDKMIRCEWPRSADRRDLAFFRTRHASN